MSTIGKIWGILLSLCIGATALAETPPVVRIRGTIAAVAGRTLTVKTRQGGEVSVALAEDATLAAPKPLEISDIKPGSFIGTAAVPGPDGGLRSLEVVVFPDSLRGTGEGHYVWDLAPDSSMTNANVEAVVAHATGREMQLAYKGGSLKIDVPATVPIVTPVSADLGEFIVGAEVFIAATRAADGQLVASRAWVARNGIAPPM